MATLSASGTGSTLTLTGTGYTGTSCDVALSFVKTGNTHRKLSLRRVPVSGGSISADLTVLDLGGIYTAKTINASGTVLATSSGVAL